MINLLLIEDERLIVSDLIHMVEREFPDVSVSGVAETVREALNILSSRPAPDLIFADVHLPDGLSFDIFSQTHSGCPVVFLTGFDQYMIRALEYNSIEYILKPADARDLEKVFQKYRHLQLHFQQKIAKDFAGFTPKKRIVVKKGHEHFPIKMEEAALFYSENKVVYVLDRNLQKFVCEKNLMQLEKELDPISFKRVNRQYILNSAFIRGYKSFEKVKLQVMLSLPECRHQVIVSQEMAGVFREWIHGI